MMVWWSIVGFLIGSLVEWIAHRYVLHNFTIRQLSHSHFRVHHKNSRKNGCLDVDYLTFPPTKYTSGLGEIIMLGALAVIVLPIFWYNIFLWAGLTTHICLYYYMHRKFHLNPIWGKRWMRWHWEHHMKNPNKNYGVVTCWVDYLLGTRKKYKENNTDKK